jgi:hypothetical protein
MAQDFQALGTQFVQFYYTTFDTNRQGLMSLYTDDSMLTFEGEQIKGMQNIFTKLSEGLSFQTIEHRVEVMDC